MTQLSRRAALRGLGATIALPLLDAMSPAFAAQTVRKALSATRMAFLYVPNGIVMDYWTPPGEVGSTPLESLPRVSSALAPYRNDLMMLSGLTSNGGRALGDGPGDHGRAGAAYLTGVHPKKTYGKDIKTGVSMDQVAARQLEGKTRFASLELGCEEGIQGGNCDNGYSCAYSNSLSWRTENTPNPPEIRPRAVFERMFGVAEDENGSGKAEAAAGLSEKHSGCRPRRCQQSEEHAGRERSPQARRVPVRHPRYREADSAGREEQRSQGAGDGPSASIPTEFHEHSMIMMDLVSLAFQTDMTRIITVLMGIEQSPRNYPEIGITEGHHGLTHHQGDKEKIEKVAQINEYHIKQFVYLLDKLKATPDGDGTLLDHSMIVYGSALADGNAHQHNNLPTVLAGRANGTLRPGRHVRYADETPITNLYLSMLDRMGVPVEQIGDSNGRLEGLSDL